MLKKKSIGVFKVFFNERFVFFVVLRNHKSWEKIKAYKIYSFVKKNKTKNSKINILDKKKITSKILVLLKG